MGPEAVVDGGEGDSPGPEEERGEHHVGAVQRVNEVRHVRAQTATLGR